MHIVFLVFGKDYKNYQQALFSILTFLFQIKEGDKIIVLTEHPEYFKSIEGSISISVLNEEILNAWKGKHQYLYRTKIEALKLAATQCKDKSLLYVDVDTFLFSDLNKIRNHLTEGFNLMHINEGMLSELKTKTEKRMWSTFKNTSYADVLVDKNTCMWNSGVIGISTEIEKTLQRVLEICDAMCNQNATLRLMEQFAFSLALDTNKLLRPADDCIGHYWGNKKQWNEIISQFFVSNFMQNLSVKEQIQKIETVDFNTTPVIVKVPNSRIRLIKRVTNLFPDKYSVFIRK